MIEAGVSAFPGPGPEEGGPGGTEDGAWTGEQVGEAVRLVLHVARMGELDIFGWWRCHGLSRTGQYVLKRAFPRTWRAAALQVDLMAAERRHEDALDKRTSAVHLFSGQLPLMRLASAWLAEQKPSEPDPLFEELAVLDREAAVGRVSALAGVDAQGEVLGNGLRVGQVTASELDDPSLAWQVGRLLGAAYAGLGEQFLAPYVDLVA